MGDSTLHVPPGQELVIRDDLGDQIPKIEDGPWPAYPADLTSIALAVATQARGTILIFEKMFENRLFFVDKLVRMGARIILCDPHRAVVTGPAKLHGSRLEAPDIPRWDGNDHGRPLRRGHLDDRQHQPDRPRLRAHRRAAPVARRTSTRSAVPARALVKLLRTRLKGVELVKAIEDYVRKLGLDAYLVGGAVRDEHRAGVQGRGLPRARCRFRPG